MQVRWRELFVCRVNAQVRWDRWDCIALAVSAMVAFWVFALKLETFYDLGYSGDLFLSVQAARSWLEGKRLLQENCFGNVLVIHTYFLLLPFGLMAKPFGAPGLLHSFGIRRGNLLLGSSNPEASFRCRAHRANRSRGNDCFPPFGRFLSGSWSRIPWGDSRAGVMFDALLFPA
jgi:hypothetical protein